MVLYIDGPVTISICCTDVLSIDSCYPIMMSHWGSISDKKDVDNIQYLKDLTQNPLPSSLSIDMAVQAVSIIPLNTMFSFDSEIEIRRTRILLWSQQGCICRRANHTAHHAWFHWTQYRSLFQQPVWRSAGKRGDSRARGYGLLCGVLDRKPAIPSERRIV